MLFAVRLYKLTLLIWHVSRCPKSVREMSPRRRRTLITAAAMAILGPAGGLAACLFIGMALLHGQTSTTTLARAIMLSAGLGALCCAIGFFIVISILLIHFLAADDPRHLPMLSIKHQPQKSQPGAVSNKAVQFTPVSQSAADFCPSHAPAPAEADPRLLAESLSP